ncbi:hypothetical protein [Stenotrophomonas sp. NPDC078853]|uniref:hypothetical protein n=1 Tax=Stenotrophomonas sp. NPDC078853 TaxID=3364534 RepID=UPI00384C89B9
MSNPDAVAAALLAQAAAMDRLAGVIEKLASTSSAQLEVVSQLLEALCEAEGVEAAPPPQVYLSGKPRG